MSRGGEIRLDWAGDEQLFRLAIGQLRELQEACDAGPYQIVRRLIDGTWRVDDIRETLRLGLIGGGMKPDAALKMVRRYVDEYGVPLLEQVPICADILRAALTGAVEEPIGDSASGEGEAASGGPESSSSPPSTVAPPSSAGPLPRSTN